MTLAGYVALNAPNPSGWNAELRVIDIMGDVEYC